MVYPTNLIFSYSLSPPAVRLFGGCGSGGSILRLFLATLLVIRHGRVFARNLGDRVGDRHAARLRVAANFRQDSEWIDLRGTYTCTVQGGVLGKRTRKGVSARKRFRKEVVCSSREAGVYEGRRKPEQDARYAIIGCSYLNELE